MRIKIHRDQLALFQTYKFPEGSARNTGVISDAHDLSRPSGLIFIADWGGNGNNFWALDWNGERLPVNDFESLLRFVPPYSTVVVESAGENFHIPNRLVLEKLAAEKPVYVRSLSGRMTRHRRIELDLEKTNENDAKIILEIVKQGRTHLGRFRFYVPEINLKRQDGSFDPDEVLIQQRVHGYPIVDKFLKSLPPPTPPTSLRDDLLMLTDGEDGKSYNHMLLATIIVATLLTKSRRSFERCLGYYGLGRNCLYRSNIYFHFVRNAVRRRANDEATSEEKRAIRSNVMKRWRRVIHEVRRWIKSSNLVPEDCSI